MLNRKLFITYATLAYSLGAYRGFNHNPSRLYVHRTAEALLYGIFYVCPVTNIICLFVELERLECKIRGIKY